MTASSINWRIISLLLLVALVAAIGMWRPWEGARNRTISVTGQASVTATPDEFIFMPTYHKEGETLQAAIAEVSSIGNSAIAKIKELGVEEKSITSTITSSDGSQPPIYKPMPAPEDTNGKPSATFSLVITIQNKEIAQKVLDYLVTTPTLYGVTPQYGFSTETRRALESAARTKAILDAKSKAESTSEGLGVKLGRVMSVSDFGGGGPIFLEGRAVPSSDRSTTNTSLTILPGEQDLDFSVTVVFQIR